MQKFRSFFFILGKIGDCFAFLSKNYLQARDVLYAVKLTNICSTRMGTYPFAVRAHPELLSRTRIGNCTS